MNLHENKDIFRELITYTSGALNVPEVYVEKDYWVTRVLLFLSNSEFKDDFIFKGGTALSKAFKLINRFSEDVDLALFNRTGLSQGQVKNRMKAAQMAITQGLNEVSRNGESKRGTFRKVYFEFPRIVEGDFGHASDVLLIETNAFADPEPFSLMPIRTLIADFLESTDRFELIEQFALGAFKVNVLDIRRTTAEKILGLIKASRSDDPEQAISDKIRHIYDLCMIKRNDQVGLFSSDALHELIKIVIRTDREQFKEKATWLDEPLHESPLFSRAEDVWKDYSQYFNNGFAEMVYDNDIPEDTEVITMLNAISSILSAMSNSINISENT